MTLHCFPARNTERAHAMSNTYTSFPLADGMPSGPGSLNLSDTAPLSQADAAPAAGERLTRVVQGAHDTIDRLAEQAVPQLQRLEEGFAGASDALQTQAHRLRETGDQWAESLRGSVRDNPLAAVAAALALGVLISRLTR